jgi:thiol-disulfide isomerase/thioredoxin
LSHSAKTPEERAEVDFAQVTALMVAMHNPTVEKREELLTAVRKFQAEHPKDRRLAALLAEAASLFDSKPKTKESLLLDAQRLATDDEIKGRVADDLKRLGFLGKEPPIRFNTAGGKSIDLAHYKGKVVFVIFFASWSQPSLMALQTFQQTLANLPAGQVQVLGVDLDEKAASLGAVEKEYHVTWPVGFDGKGWESPLVRNLGINTLPTIWLIDTKGVLRSINAVENGATQARLLLDEK